MKTQGQNLPRRSVKIKLPFQYTEEGRKQLEEKRSLLPASLESLSAWVLPTLEEITNMPDVSYNEPRRLNPEPPRDKQFTESHASYLSPIFRDPALVTRDAARELANVDFDTIIGSGISGALAVQMLAKELGVHYAIVRKPNDGTHSMNIVEGRIGRRWVFVDDLIASGKTLRRVIDSMNDHCRHRNWETKRIGSYLYNDRRFYAPGDYPGIAGL